MKKKKGQHNPLSKESIKQEQSQPLLPKDETKQPQCDLCRLWQKIKVCWAIVSKLFWRGLELSAILGILGFYYQFSPNVSVTPHVGFSGQNPLLIPFVIANNGPLNLRNLKASCFLLNVQYETGSSIEGDIAKFTDQDSVAAGESLTILCDQYRTDSPVAFANITVDVTFEIFPYYYFRQEKRSVRFIASKNKDGNWHWLPQPMKESEPLEESGTGISK